MEKLMLKFELVTLDGTKFSNQVYEVLLPTPLGQIAVFAHHAPLVSLASPGIIQVRVKQNDPDDFMEIYATNGGVIEVEDNIVRVLVDEADEPDEINEQEAEKAHAEAMQLMASAQDQVSLQHAQTILDRTAVRLKVAELKRHRRNRKTPENIN
jgi:F-type H+-transporting ATPase subunit epsilon